jgi:hypothetical protein
MEKPHDPKVLVVNEQVCAERHKRVDEKMDCYEHDIKVINQKITGTLVFAVVTLITVVLGLLMR